MSEPVKCLTKNCSFRVTQFDLVDEEGGYLLYCCLRCKEGMGHGVWCDRNPYAGPLPPTEYRLPPLSPAFVTTQYRRPPLPPTQNDRVPLPLPLPMAFEWDAASNNSNRRKWKSYTYDLQRFLNVGWKRWKDIGQAACCYEFLRGKDEYLIDWTTMTQTNKQSNRLSEKHSDAVRAAIKLS